MAALIVGLGLRPHGADPGAAIRFVPLVFLVVPILILFVVWLGAPRGFSVDDSSVRVERRLGLLSIPLRSIREVREIVPPVYFQRSGGVGGFFGYVGDYRHPQLGKVQLFATRSDGQVLLDTGLIRYVLTPGSPAAFVAEVRKRAGQRPG